MKCLKVLVSIIMTILISVVILPSKQCKAIITPADIPMINQMVENRINEIYGQTSIGNGNMSTGAYNYCQFLDGEKNKLWQEVNALKGNVGASSQDVNEVKGKVDETNNKIDSVQKSVDSIDVQKDLEEYMDSITEENDGTMSDGVFRFSDTILTCTDYLWTIAGDTIKGVGATDEFGYTLDIESYSKTGLIKDIFVPIAYSIVLLFFAINLVEITVKYEMLSLKSIIILTVRIMVAKILIDKSGQICMGIIDIMSDLCTQIIDEGDSVLLGLSNVSDAIRDSFVNSKTKFVGPIIDFLVAAVLVIPLIFIGIVVLVVVIMVLVKLIFRAFELVSLIVTSPVFFACWSSDVTKQYFRNFVVTFVQVSAQIVYMAVMYYVGARWTMQEIDASSMQSGADVLAWFMKFLPNTIVIIGIGIMMVKPPKALSNLIH